MAKNINELLDDRGYNELSIKCVCKRTEGEDGVRGFYGRWVWSIENNNTKFECDWVGFATAEECIADLLEKF